MNIFKTFASLVSLVAFTFVGCDDSSSASAGPNDEPGIESSSSVEQGSSSSEKAKSSSSDTQNDAKQSSSSEKTGKSSSSVNEVSSSSVKSESSYSVEESQSSSGEKELSSSSVALATPCKTETEDNCEYGILIDERDGQEYKTVKIGDQLWMAENLNYYDSTNLSVKYKSWCYGKSDNKDSSTCDETGRLYKWAAAIDSVKLVNDADNPQDCGYDKKCTLPAKAQGICPPNWHLPDTTEWNTLFTTVGGSSTAGKVLKSQNDWISKGNGVDAFGFSALPAGGRYYYGGFSYGGVGADFWSSTDGYSYEAYHMYLNYLSDEAYLDYDDKGCGFSVRCVKD